MAAYFPTQIITEILTRLSVKPLLRFRCVSKTWCSLIDNPDFIKSHLKHTLETSKDQTLILKHHKIHCVDFPGLTRAKEMEHPFQGLNYMVEVMGSVNGLVCLGIGEEEGIVIYNPATRDNRVLPVSPVEFPFPELHTFMCVEMFVYGFGYDHVNDDYKFVRIVQFNLFVEGFYNSEVKVYSVKLKSWKRVDDLPTCYTMAYQKGWGIFVNGCLHWVVKDRKGSKSIVSFDLGSEKFEVVKHPDCGNDDQVHMTVGVLKGSLFALCNYPRDRSEIWVMEEYGVEESWMKLFTVPQYGVVGSFNYVRPLGYSKDGNSVLIEQDVQRLFWFDLRRETAQSVEIRDMPALFDGTSMMIESLVPVNDPKRKKPKRKRSEQTGPAGSLVARLTKPLLFNVLSRLCADNLVELKFVCKAWNDAVDDPELAKLHLKVSGESNDSLHIIIEAKELHLVDFPLLDIAVQINHPLSSPRTHTEIIGSCNGLVCLYNQDLEFAIWNPLTGKGHKIPLIRFQTDLIPQFYVHGFGYDPLSQDYKIVRIMLGQGSTAIQVYSIRSKKWKKIGWVPFNISSLCSGVLASGALHWIAKPEHAAKDAPRTIMAFELGTEKCKEVSRPDCDDIRYSSLGLLGGSLCLICHDTDSGVEDVWLLKDYKMNSWYKVISITQPITTDYSKIINPLTYSKDGSEVLLQEGKAKFIWYNLEKKTIRDVNANGLPERFKSGVVFAGSLVDPKYISGVSEIDETTVNRTRLLALHKNRCNNESNEPAPSKTQSGKVKKRDGLDGFLAKGFKLKL